MPKSFFSVAFFLAHPVTLTLVTCFKATKHTHMHKPVLQHWEGPQGRDAADAWATLAKLELPRPRHHKLKTSALSSKPAVIKICQGQYSGA